MNEHKIEGKWIFLRPQVGGKVQEFLTDYVCVNLLLPLLQTETVIVSETLRWLEYGTIENPKTHNSEFYVTVRKDKRKKKHAYYVALNINST
jgi:hypothetical protein